MPTEQRLEANKNGVCNTLTSVQKDNLLLEPETQQVVIGGMQANQTTKTDGVLYRIRKLTPKECWRLMGFSDEDFEKAQKINSNSQLYKQAGNSIVVDVLEGIFKNLF